LLDYVYALFFLPGEIMISIMDNRRLGSMVFSFEEVDRIPHRNVRIWIPFANDGQDGNLDIHWAIQQTEGVGKKIHQTLGAGIILRIIVKKIEGRTVAYPMKRIGF
jgi:hypothetical protein